MLAPPPTLVGIAQRSLAACPSSSGQPPSLSKLCWLPHRPSRQQRRPAPCRRTKVGQAAAAAGATAHRRCGGSPGPPAPLGEPVLTSGCHKHGAAAASEPARRHHAKLALAVPPASCGSPSRSSVTLAVPGRGQRRAAAACRQPAARRRPAAATRRCCLQAAASLPRWQHIQAVHYPASCAVYLRICACPLRPVAGKGGKNRRRGKNDSDDKRELIFKEDGQGALLDLCFGMCHADMWAV